LNWIEVRLVGASYGDPQTHQFAGGREAAFAMVLLTSAGFRVTLGETRCATRIGNVALEERISRNEVGRGELRWPATALLVRQPRVLGPTQRAHLRSGLSIRQAACTTVTGRVIGHSD
jgi:hypothetical protein